MCAVQCPDSCGECTACYDPAVGCQPVADGESCGNGAGQCIGGACGVSALATEWSFPVLMRAKLWPASRRGT